LTLQSGTTKRFELLDALRLLAALSVVLYHYAFRSTGADGLTSVAIPSMSHIARYGYLGVYLFFIISGFVIACSAEKRSAIAFLLYRCVRIYPAFLLCMTTTALAMALFADPNFVITWGKWAGNLLIDAPRFGQGFVDGVYWTLVYELTFYVWIAMLIGVGVFPRWICQITLIWLAVSVLNETTVRSSLLSQYLLTDQSGFFALGLAVYRLYRCEERPIGSVRAPLAGDFRSGRMRAWTSVARGGCFQLYPLAVFGLALAVAIFQALQLLPHLNKNYSVTFDPIIVSTLIVGSTALVAVAPWVPQSPSIAPITMVMGGLTYPLYLLHANIGFLILNKVGNTISHSALITGTAVAMVAISWAAWRWVERPAQTAIRFLIKRVLDVNSAHLVSRAQDLSDPGKAKQG
jgi:peptidoglycan/LPS O-acetylase OafA/YrhL